MAGVSVIGTWITIICWAIVVECDRTLSNKKGMTIHIIPHSHMDTGWLKTVDDYYSQNVQYIYSNVVISLMSDKNRRFLVAETLFFKMFYEDYEHFQENIHHLVENGQLEFAGGGWCMADEGCPMAESVIDNMELGHRWIVATFGVTARPRIGWQIDPAGLSSLTPVLYDAMGFLGHVIQRVDRRWKNAFIENRSMEFLWQGSPRNNPASMLWTHATYQSYGSPPSFSWEGSGAEGTVTPWNVANGKNLACSMDPHANPPVLDKPISNLTPANVAERAHAFVDFVKGKSSAYAYGDQHMLQMLGGDMNFQNALMMFSNMERIIRFVNGANASAFENVTLRWSTMSEYQNATVGVANRERSVSSGQQTSKEPHTNDRPPSGADVWPTVQHDFYPYRNGQSASWRSGLYTSRPYLKGLIRKVAGVLRSVEVLFSLSSTCVVASDRANIADRIQIGREAVSVGQHHDSIVGTMLDGTAGSDDVLGDYIQQLSVAQSDMEAISGFLADAMCRCTNCSRANVVSTRADARLPKQLRYVRARYRSGSSMQVTEREPRVSIATERTSASNTSVVIKVFNSLSFPIARIVNVSLPTSWRSRMFAVIDAQHEPVAAQRSADGTRVWVNVSLPALGFQEYMLVASTRFRGEHMVSATTVERVPGARTTHEAEDVVLANEHVRLYFNASSAALYRMGSFEGGAWVNRSLARSLFLYKSNDTQTFEAPDAYVFWPEAGPPLELQNPTLSIHSGTLVHEVHLQYTRTIRVVFRLFQTLPEEDGVLVEVVNYVQLADVNTNLVVQYGSSIASNGHFAADANGRESRQREYNPVQEDNVVAGNFYPCPCRAVLEDAATTLAVINDRAQAVSSLPSAMHTGTLDFIVHRRVVVTRSYVQINDTSAIEQYSYLVLRGKGPPTSNKSASYLSRRAVFLRNYPPLVVATEQELLSVHATTPERQRSNTTGVIHSDTLSAVSQGMLKLPANVFLLSLKLNALGISACPQDDVRLLLRLAHVYEKSEDPEWSNDATVKLESLFDANMVKIKSAYEVLLSGSAFASMHNGQPVATNLSQPIRLVPMQILSFELCTVPMPTL
eukprot:m.986401 g.986401  ORF g.986401 m.986401 type:complete len:1079 (-) comp23989_c0_seq3:41-3277(-)